MDLKISYDKLIRIYLILFQVCCAYSSEKSIINFVVRYNFEQKLA